jgi:hypothetical protein
MHCSECPISRIHRFYIRDAAEQLVTVRLVAVTPRCNALVCMHCSECPTSRIHHFYILYTAADSCIPHAPAAMAHTANAFVRMHRDELTQCSPRRSRVICQHTRIANRHGEANQVPFSRIHCGHQDHYLQHHKHEMYIHYDNVRPVSSKSFQIVREIDENSCECAVIFMTEKSKPNLLTNRNATRNILVRINLKQEKKRLRTQKNVNTTIKAVVKKYHHQYRY